MDYYDIHDMTPEEEHQQWLDDCLDAVAWPIDDEGYEASLDAQAKSE